LDIATLDIESTDLAAVGSGVLLCAVIKPIRKAPITFRYDEMKCRPGHEKRLVAAVLDEIAKYHLLIGHNLVNFDFPFLKSRAMYFNITTVPHPLAYDTYKAFRRVGYRTRLNGYGKPAASLAFVADFFGVPQEKTGIYPREWWTVVWEEGKRRQEAMDAICAHCVSDTRMTEEVYWKLMPQDVNARIERLR